MIDRIICLIGLALAAVYFYATAQIPSLEIGDPLGPKAFPILLGTVLLIAIVMLFVETLTAGARDAKRVYWWRQDRHHLLLIGGVALWAAPFFLTFHSAGYLVFTAIYFLVMIAGFNPGEWVANTPSA